MNIAICILFVIALGVFVSGVRDLIASFGGSHGSKA